MASFGMNSALFWIRNNWESARRLLGPFSGLILTASCSGVPQVQSTSAAPARDMIQILSGVSLLQNDRGFSVERGFPELSGGRRIVFGLDAFWEDRDCRLQQSCVQLQSLRSTVFLLPSIEDLKDLPTHLSSSKSYTFLPPWSEDRRQWLYLPDVLGFDHSWEIAYVRNPEFLLQKKSDGLPVWRQTSLSHKAGNSRGHDQASKIHNRIVFTDLMSSDEVDSLRGELCQNSQLIWVQRNSDGDLDVPCKSRMMGGSVGVGSYLVVTDQNSLELRQFQDAHVAQNIVVAYRGRLHKKTVPASQTTLVRGLARSDLDLWVASALQRSASVDVAIVRSGRVLGNLWPGVITSAHVLGRLGDTEAVYGIDWARKDFEKALCFAASTPAAQHSHLVFSGVEIVRSNGCQIEGLRGQRVKVGLTETLVKNSLQYFGQSIESRAFRFGMTIDQVVAREFQTLSR